MTYYLGASSYTDYYFPCPPSKTSHPPPPHLNLPQPHFPPDARAVANVGGVVGGRFPLLIHIITLVPSLIRIITFHTPLPKPPTPPLTFRNHISRRTRAQSPVRGGGGGWEVPPPYTYYYIGGRRCSGLIRIITFRPPAFPNLPPTTPQCLIFARAWSADTFQKSHKH